MFSLKKVTMSFQKQIVLCFYILFFNPFKAGVKGCQSFITAHEYVSAVQGLISFYHVLSFSRMSAASSTPIIKSSSPVSQLIISSVLKPDVPGVCWFNESVETNSEAASLKVVL